jgi:hypothetical protein
MVSWNPHLSPKDQKTNIEGFFQMVVRNAIRTQDECLRILNNGGLTPEEKEDLLREQAEENRRDVIRYRDIARQLMDARRREVEEKYRKDAPKRELKLSRVDEEWRYLDLLVELLFPGCSPPAAADGTANPPPR